MKKTISILTAFVLLSLLCLPASAAFPRGIRGNVYPTDIRTYMFGAPITAYNIWGQTIIDAEILNWYYGFEVNWHADERLLTIVDLGMDFVSEQAKSGELVVDYDELTGDYANCYWYTDIVTKLNGREITSYNLGGRTFIVAEELCDFGYNVIWEPDERILKIERPSEYIGFETELGTIDGRMALKHDGVVIPVGRSLRVTDDGGSEHLLKMPSRGLITVSGNVYVRLSDVSELLGAEMTLGESSVELTISQPTPPYDLRPSNAEDGLMSMGSPMDTVPYNLAAFKLYVNGVEWPITRASQSIPHEAETWHLTVLDGEFIIPAHTAAKLLGFTEGR